ncbi:endonuclease/exonuclease/phosphatase family protein [Echinicola sp. 20G]|uniref:endonuclease/exonuclease/phosphatase family protein n=1 Tax=Echinicola sp. 20G TaxID=2781961 RepID=UPI00191072B9|nr:endonuclease/exonuclease/phosphatase family protein [Echinicola sp. 20G]
MKGKLLLILIVFTCFQSFGQNDEKLKVISYNIWNGYDWGKDTLRRKQLCNWVDEQKPEVVALQELCSYTPEKLQKDAESWGHPYSELLKTTGYSVGITSSSPITVISKLFGNLHHGALHVKINEINYLVVHLHPGSIKRRREEVDILKAYIQDNIDRDEGLMVLGDFNTHSPLDASLYEEKPDWLQKDWDNNKDKGLDGNMAVKMQLDYAVMAGFMGVPLFDSVWQSERTGKGMESFPAMVLTDKEKKGIEIPANERIDYIMISENLQGELIKAYVANGKENWYLSDHYPVVADFDITK